MEPNTVNIKPVNSETSEQVLTTFFGAFPEDRARPREQGVPGTPDLRTTCIKIVEQVAQKHGTSVRSLMNPGRFKGLLGRRDEALWLCRSETKVIFSDLGALFGIDASSARDAFWRHDATVKKEPAED
jgi:hypothetical protein